MRLLKIGPGNGLTMTKDLPDPPGFYAILSHRWGADEDEVTLDNWDNPSNRNKLGYRKLVFCAEQAKRDGLEYFWVDTCCIDKRSAVELDEAIRSMFRWYKDAKKCYVYLPDVHVGCANNSMIPPTWEPAFRKSIWFRRGWTLQELLAPKVVEFFSSDRCFLGTKLDLVRQIHEITEIPTGALCGGDLSNYSIEERFRWVQNRETFKVEDKAYCLFGIFDVSSLTIKYGEREKAFERLKQEIGISIVQIDNTIKEVYNVRRLEVERLSGRSLPLEECFVNLCIIDHQNDKDKISNRVSPPQSSLVGEASPASKQIPLQDIFNYRNQKAGSKPQPGRILIWGSAGMGKTTLCKKIVHDFYHHSLWQDLYDRVVWLPLRRLKLREHESDDTIGLIKKEFLSNRSERNLIAQVQEKVINSPRTLFILDGLDEVSYALNTDTSIGCVLDDLLNQPSIIVTSRPHYTGMLDHVRLDLELETTGFLPNQIEQYIYRVAKQTNMPDQTASEIQNFIASRPTVQSLARIPVQLDAICYVWNTKHLPKDNVTMTSLYQAISQKLWAKDIVRLGKRHEGRRITTPQLELCKNVDSFVEHETEFLQRLGFVGLCNEIVEFETTEIERAQGNLPLLGDSPIHLSFLRSSDTSLDVSDRSLHFIHLTYQEFFAAQYFVRHWISNTPLLLQRSLQDVSTVGTLSSTEPEDFLRREKYTSRYNIFWRFVVGLLYEEEESDHLHRFLEAIEKEPHDLIGLTHQRFTMHCLNEIGPVAGRMGSRIRERKDLYFRWGLCRIKLGNSDWNLEYPTSLDRSDYVLEKLLRTRETRFPTMRSLLRVANLSSPILSIVLELLHEETDPLFRDRAIVVLGRQRNHSHKEELLTFWRQAQSRSTAQRIEIATSLRGCSTGLQRPAIEALTSFLQDQEANVRLAAADVLYIQDCLPRSTIETLTAPLYSPNEDIQIRAMEHLSCISNYPDWVSEALVSLLHSKNQEIQYKAVRALQPSVKLPASITKALISLLHSPNEDVQTRVIKAVCVFHDPPGSIIDALVSLFGSLKDPTRFSVIAALLRCRSLPNSASKVILTILQDPSHHYFLRAVEYFCWQSHLSDSVIESLATMLRDPIDRIRSAAAVSLGGQSDLPTSVVGALSTLLHDPDKDVQSRAATALCNQPSPSDLAVQTLLASFQATEESVDFVWRLDMVCDLFNRSLHSSAIEGLITLLQTEQKVVRRRVFRKLYHLFSMNPDTLPCSAIKGLFSIYEMRLHLNEMRLLVS